MTFSDAMKLKEVITARKTIEELMNGNLPQPQPVHTSNQSMANGNTEAEFEDVHSSSLNGNSMTHDMTISSQNVSEMEGSATDKPESTNDVLLATDTVITKNDIIPEDAEMKES